MGLWNYCEVCGERIETGQPCIGVKEESENLCGSSICMNCAKIENLSDGKNPVSITDLLARADEAEKRCKEMEDRCKRLDEARENANEAAAKWEGMYRLALERAEKEEIARKQRNVMVCPVCQGRGRVHTSFYGYGNCSMEDVRNDKFPSVCHCCGGKGILLVNEIKEE